MNTKRFRWAICRSAMSGIWLILHHGIDWRTKKLFKEIFLILFNEKLINHNLTLSEVSYLMGNYYI